MEREHGSQARLLEGESHLSPCGTRPARKPPDQPLHPSAGNSGMMVAWPGGAGQQATTAHRPSCPSSSQWLDSPLLWQDSV